MALLNGARLGPYEILAPLGQGGMGEVYKAKDTRLDRTVAIKVLSEALAADPQFRERFDREARIISQLDHPHICALYDVGREPLRRPVLDTREDDGPSASGVGVGPHAIEFLVMQYLEGETLAQRLQSVASGFPPSLRFGEARRSAAREGGSRTNTGLPISEALTIAIQIASALDAAHRVGVTHRDLKPGNVMLTKTGAARQGLPHAKLLDFGLAKTTGVGRVLGPAGVPGPQDPAYVPTALPTVPPSLTGQGTILGTFQYMAPEQIEGAEADARTDIFAFGALVYEMLTGRKAFEGKSHASLIGAILKDEPPPISSVRSQARSTSSSAGSGAREQVDVAESPDRATTGALDRVLRRCLAKTPEDRWQSASDLTEALRWIAEGRWPSETAPAAATRTVTRERLAWAAALIAVLGLGTWAFVRPRPTLHRPLARFTIAVPEGDLFSGAVAISPDGTSIVYGVTRKGVLMLYRRAIDQVEPVPIRGTENAQYPFFSPDAKWIGFFADNALKKVPAEGGPATTLCPAGFRRGASWGRDGTIVFSSDPSLDLMQVPEAGGVPQPAVRAAEFSGAQLRWPHLLPDARTVLFTTGGESLQNARIAAHSFETNKSQTLLEGSNPVYAETGHLLFARGGSLWSVPFDPRRLTIGGSPAPVLEGLQVNVGGLALFALASDGSLISVPGDEGTRRTAVWVTRAGVVQPLIEQPQSYVGIPLLSPDGNVLAAAIDDGPGRDIWTYDLGRHVLSRLTFDKGREGNPVWTSDGQRIVFTGDTPEGNANLFWTRADGAGTPERLTRSASNQTPTSVSPDGKFLAFYQQGSGTGWDLWVLPLQGDRKPQLFLRTSFNERDAAFSPDGRLIAYASDETGRSELYVRPFPGPGGKWQVSTSGLTTVPLVGWRADGKELFYGSSLAGPTVMAGLVDLRDVFKAEQPHALFTAPSALNVFALSVTQDGSRFVGLQSGEATTTQQLDLTLNWLDDLKTRMPSGQK